MGKQGEKLSDAKRKAIVDGLKQGKAIREIAVAESVAPSTVSLYREKHRDELPSWKRRTRQVLMEAAETLASAISQQAAQGGGNIQQNALSLGILSTKITTELSENSNLLGVIEHRHELGASMAGWVGNRAENAAHSSTKPANVGEIGGKVDNVDEMEARTPPAKD